MSKVEPIKIEETIPLSSGISVKTDATPRIDKGSDEFFDESDAKILEEAGKKGVFERTPNEDPD